MATSSWTPDQRVLTYTKRYALVVPDGTYDEETAKSRRHPEVRRYLRYMPENFSTEDAANLREERALNPTIYQFNVVAIDETQSREKYVGGAMLQAVNLFHRNCEAGLIVSPEYHRKGVATDVLHRLLSFAFDDLKMHRVNFITGEDNTGMRGWLDNLLKATCEGVKREKWIEPEGGFCNAVEYSILEDEWRSVGKKSLEDKMDSRQGQ